MEKFFEQYTTIAQNFPSACSDYLPLLSFQSVFISCSLYLLFCFLLQKILGVKKDRVDSGFTYYLGLVHNFNMFFFSLVCFLGLAYETYNAYKKDGFESIFCDSTSKNVKGGMTFWIYLYYLSKFYEFLDTLIIVLRRSQLRFIHVYHHVTTMLVAFLGLWSCSTAMWIPILLNTLVHVIMYYYYILVCLGQKVWWKNFLTDFQLFQFVVDIVSFKFWLYIYYFEMMPIGKKCSGDFNFGLIADFVLITFFFLFLRLRIQNSRRQNTDQKEKNH